MSKWLKNIIGFLILGALLWYLVSHWDQLKVLLKLSGGELFLMYFLWFLVMFNSAFVVQFLVKALSIKPDFWDMVRLNHAALLLNYVPMKFGTLFRANYLKHHYGLAYAHFATFFLYITFLMTATASGIGLIILAGTYGLDGYENKVLAGIFALTVIASLLFLFIPLPLPKGQRRIIKLLRNFLSGREQISKGKNTVLLVSVLLALNFLLVALRLGIIYHSMGKDIHFGGYLILGALGFVVLFIGLTPGSLGVRELVLSFGAVVLGVPFEVGLLAAMVDRAVTISYSFVAGGCCTAWLWHKSPTDFKRGETEQNNLTG